LNRIGSSLQTSGQVTLAGADHGGVTVRLTTSDPAVLRLSADAVTPGTSIIEVFIDDGSTTAPVFFQGVAGATGPVTVTAAQAQFTDGTAAVNVVPALFNYSGLVTTTNTLAANDPFNLFTYSTNAAGTGIQQFQHLSAGNGPLTVTLTSSDPAVGQLVGTTTGGTVQIELQLGGSQTNVPIPEFDALSGGTTTITATAPGFDTALSSRTVTVAAAPPP
jgi:hypothetical protein